MVYNLTAFDAATNPYGQFAAMNAASNFVLVYLLLLSVFIVSFIMMAMFDTKYAFITSSAFVMLLSIGFFFAKLIGQVGMIFCIFIFFLSVGVYLIGKE